LILAGNQITVRNVIVSYVVAAIAHNCILFTISFYFVRRNEPGMLSFPINWGLARDYLRFTWRTFTSSLLKAGNQNVENLIIAYFTSTEMAGMYKILHNILTPVRFISAPLSQLAYPKLVRLYEQQQFKQITAYLISTNKVILCVALPYVAAAVLLLHPVLQLLNSDYVLPNMRVSFAMLGVAFVVQAMFGWWVRAYSNAKNPNYSITMGVFQSLYIILIGALCTWRWGVHGFCGSYLAMVVMASAYWMRKLRAIEDGDTLLVGDQTSVQDRPSVAPQTTLQRTCPLG